MRESLHESTGRMFQALASPVRLRMLELLRASGSMTVSEIQQRLGIEAPNASQHLAILRERGLVTRRREGTSIWYAVADQQLYRLMDDARTLLERRSAADARVLDGAEAGRGRGGRAFGG